MVRRRVVESAHPLLRDLRWPVFEASGARDGPRLTLMAGIHGCEYPAIDAVRRFMRELDTATLAGSILAVPIASPTSFAARRAFVVPEDGRNLNRAFPGDPDGSFTEALADHLFETFIAGSDLLIDVHGGDLFEALEPFALFDASPREDDALALARAYGLSWVVRDETGELGGTTSAAAAAAGIAAITAEAGGCGLLERDAVDRHLRGIRGALVAAGMLDGPSAPPGAAPAQHLVRAFRWLRCERAGWWDADAGPGTPFTSGERLGVVRDAFGDEQETIEAPAAGVVLFVTSSPAVADGGLLLGLGCELEELA